MANILEVFSIAKNIPRYVGDDDTDNLNVAVTLRDIEVVLKWFKNTRTQDRMDGPLNFIYPSFII